MLRTIRQVPEEADRKYLKDWAREEFKRNKEATDQVKNHANISNVSSSSSTTTTYSIKGAQKSLAEGQMEKSECTWRHMPYSIV